MRDKRVVLVGGGGHASDVLGVYERIHGVGQHPVVGMVADSEIDPRRFVGRNVRQLGDLSDLKHLDVTHYVVAVGYSKPRRQVAARLAGVGLIPDTVIHPSAEIGGGVPIGEGSVIMANVCISQTAEIGRHVCISYGALVGHDCKAMDFCTVLPGAAISGETMLGEACLIGTNATIVERLHIGDGAIVGAGAVVLKDVPGDLTVVGVPAKPLT